MSFTQAYSQLPKPRRRLKDTFTDKADGFDILIQKTKAIDILEQQPEINLGQDEEAAYHALYSHDIDANLTGVRFFRQYVCGEGSDQRAQNMIDWNILGRLTWFLQPHVPEPLVFETLWIITNIAAGPTSHTCAIVDNNFLPFMTRLLQHQKMYIRTQAAWAIGNIVGDREGFRDIVLQHGILEPLLQIWQGEYEVENQKKEAFRIAMWVVDNMCRYKPNWHEMYPVFQMLPTALLEDDHSLLKECCWALARILHQSGRHPVIDQMITKSMCDRLVEILRENNTVTMHPILRALINLSSSKNPLHLAYLVDANLIEQLDFILLDFFVAKQCRTNLNIFAIQILGNIALHQEHADRIMRIGRLIVFFCKCLTSKQMDKTIQGEIVVVLRNLLFHKSEEIKDYLLRCGIVEKLIYYMNNSKKDSKFQLAALDVAGLLASSINKDDEGLESLKYHKGFDAILGILQSNCVNWDSNEFSEDEESDSDVETQKSVNAFNLNLTPVEQVHPSRKTKNKLILKSKQLLETYFTAEWNAVKLMNMEAQELSRGMDQMNVSGDCYLNDLIDGFKAMNKDSAVNLE